MAWLTPKLDWTSKDYYNAEDLNRVENNTLEVKNLLERLRNRTISLGEIVTNRDYSSIEFAESLTRVEDNIDTLGAYYKPKGWEVNLSWVAGQSFSYVDALRLEKNLFLLYEFIKPNLENTKYCGTFACGEEDFI